MVSITVPNMNNYKSVRVVYKGYVGDATPNSVIFANDGAKYPASASCLSATSDYSRGGLIRFASFDNSNKMYFTNCVDIASPGTAQNSYCVPIKVYGINATIKE